MVLNLFQVRALLDWYMVSDPFPLSEQQHNEITEFMNMISIAEGYDDWVDAYHNLKRYER